MVERHLTGAHKINSYFSWAINTYIYRWLIKPVYIYIYIHEYMYVLNESERDIDQVIQFDVFFLPDFNFRSQMKKPKFYKKEKQMFLKVLLVSQCTL